MKLFMILIYKIVNKIRFIWLIHEVFFEIEDEKLDILYNKRRFNYKGYGVIFLNKSAVLKNYKNNPEKIWIFKYIKRKRNQKLFIKSI